MSNEILKGSSYAYRVTDNLRGTGVSQFNFEEHGRDRATQLLAPQMRLSLELFSPEQQWKQEGVFYVRSYLDVRLGKLRMNYRQFEATTREIFKNLGIVGPMLQFKQFQEGAVHMVRVELPQQQLHEKTEAMDALYWEANKAQKLRSNPSPSR